MIEHSPIKKRAPITPLPELQRNYNEILFSIRNVMECDILEFSNSVALQRLVAELKKLWMEYSKAAATLIDKFIKVASLEQAQLTKYEKTEVRVEVRQTIEMANEVLKKLQEEELSNIDSQSVASLPILPAEADEASSNLSDPQQQDTFQYSDEQSSAGPNDFYQRTNTGPSVVYTAQTLVSSDVVELSVSPKQLTPRPLSVASVTNMQSTNTDKPVKHQSISFDDTGPSVRPKTGFSDHKKPIDKLSSYFQNLNIGKSTINKIQHPVSSAVVLSSEYHAPPSLSVTTVAASQSTSVSLSNLFHGAASFTPRSRGYTTTSSPYNMPIDGNVFPMCEDNTPNQMDAASHHLIKQELFKQSSSPYDGSPQLFKSWILLLENRMRNINLDPLDIISILIANTIGEPNKIIVDYLAAGAASPAATLQKIWQFLHKEYGAPVKVCQSILRKLEECPCVRPPHMNKKLKELIHLCNIIEANMSTNDELLIFRLNSGQKQIWSKLPDWLQRKWRSQGFRFSVENMGNLPPFQNLLDFLQYSLDEMTDPNYDLPVQNKETRRTLTTHAITPKEDVQHKCIYHNKSGHSLSSCHSFAKMKYTEKQKFAFENKLCFKCLGHHLARNCDSNPKCTKCHRDHIPAMHPDRQVHLDHSGRMSPANNYNHERQVHSNQRKSSWVNHEEKNMCSVVCGDPRRALNCSKTVLCELYHRSKPEETLRVYAVIDDCSDSSYVSEKVIKHMKLSGVKTRYLLSTMESMRTEHEALVVEGLWIRGVNKDKCFSLPELYTSKFIPGSLYEIGTPDIVKSISHIKHLADRFLDLDDCCEPLILLGRDCGDLMKCTYYGDHAPFVCETPLGYTLIGSPCPYDKSNKLSVRKTMRTIHEHYEMKPLLPPTDPSYSQIFKETEDDDTPGLSREDEKFLDIVKNSIHVNNSGHVTICLPFRNDSVYLPDNRIPVYHRTLSTLSKLKMDPQKIRQCVDAMEKDIAKGHVERVPENEIEPLPGKAWWLPIFAVSHPKKEKCRLVFDSSASYKSTSLNSALLQGPDENNRLRGVLMRFRIGEVAFGADIESMFYNFHLPETDKDFLRFYWFENNNPNVKIVQYRGRVHLFGNKPSPAIAHAGLLYTTQHPEAAKHPEAIAYISNNIYVDDLLAACISAEDAITYLENIRSIFRRYHIRLCKIVSNKTQVMEHFEESERAQTVKLDIGGSTVHRALGLSWQVKEDNFVINVDLPNKPLTRRGILSITNSLYDPIGMVGPVVLTSKLIQRKALKKETGGSYDWDDPLPDHFAKDWKDWLESLAELPSISLSRSYIPKSFGKVCSYELHTFSDASESAIGAVCYMRIMNDRGDTHVSFIISATKLLPKSCISMPRSELCAALLGAKLYKEVKCELKLPIDRYFMYSDSMVVLAYLVNNEKRFAKYIAHRISCILKLTKPSQWLYINTTLNPADIASRPCTPLALSQSVWFTGPDFLWRGDTWILPCPDPHADLPEVIRENTVTKTEKHYECRINDITKSVSSFLKAINVVTVVLQFSSSLLSTVCKRSIISMDRNVALEQALTCLIIAVQHSCYSQLIRALDSKNSESLNIHKQAPLDPYLDDKGIIRVGGRLRASHLSYSMRHPVLLPKDHALSTLVVRHYHEAVKHQGRHLTMGAVREAGYFIEKGSKLIRLVINACVHCRRLRADPAEQFMASLPLSRVENTVPFHHTGVDVFGPYVISENKSTRQTKGTKKIWGLILTCMTSRALHVEPLQGLDTTSLANALRRFIAVRGSCRNIYSDQGTNFIGISNLSEHFCDRQIAWHFNPPHASHFGGAWERKIGALKKVFEGTMTQLKGRILNRDEFSTLLLEAMAIVNHTPMWEISTDPRDPLPISPAMLLTLRDSDYAPSLGSYTADDIASYGAKRWRKVQFLADAFWQKWRTYYLSGLQERSKWIFKNRNIEVGDVVLLVNKGEGRNSWPLAIVEEVKLSSDKLVRSVTVRTSSGGSSRKTYNRPISDVILLVPTSGKEECSQDVVTDGSRVS